MIFCQRLFSVFRTAGEIVTLKTIKNIDQIFYRVGMNGAFCRDFGFGVEARCVFKIYWNVFPIVGDKLVCN